MPLMIAEYESPEPPSRRTPPSGRVSMPAGATSPTPRYPAARGPDYPQNGRVAPGVVARAREDDLAALDDVEAAAVLRHVVDVRLGDQDRAAEARDLGDALGDGGNDRRGEPLERLVEHEHLRVERERPRDREHLALAAAHLGAPAGGVAPEPGEDAVRELDALRGGPPGRPRPRRDLDVLRDREGGEDGGVLGRPAEAAPRDLVRRPAVDRLAPERDAAPARGQEAPDGAERRGLAPPVPPDEAHDPPRPPPPRHAPEGGA